MPIARRVFQASPFSKRLAMGDGSLASAAFSIFKNLNF